MKKSIKISIISLAIVVAIGVVSFAFIHNSYKAEVTIDNQIQKISKEECKRLTGEYLEDDAADTQYFMVKLKVENYGEYEVYNVDLSIITSSKVVPLNAGFFDPYNIKSGGESTLAFFLKASGDMREEEILEILSHRQLATICLGDPSVDSISYKKQKPVLTKMEAIEDTGELQYPKWVW